MAKSEPFTRVWVPPESHVSPPVRTRPQALPLNELSWDSFQRLCARLAQRCGNTEHVQGYGLPGQDQEGIDIYVRRPESSKYSVWQCKRYKAFRPSLVEGAVSDFLNGAWVSKTDEFVLAVTVNTEEANLAEAIETQAERLHGQSIQFLPLGITEISERLKDHPDLVDDFFGREWTKTFCGEEAAARLSIRRLQPAEVIRLRQLLRNCYTQHFEITDPGLPSLTGSINPDHQPLPLVERFVPPDILEEQQVSHTEIFNYSSGDQDGRRPRADGTKDSSSSRRTRVTTRTLEVRRPAIDWLSDSDLSVVLGDPGIGKSTLLRCVLLDLLSTEPRYETCARRWGQYLPVWVPFAMWTRLVSESEEYSLSDVLETWLHKVSAEENLITLVREALEDSRLLLFVDGLDEWSDETAARTALTLLEQFVGERKVPVIASSRPLGYARLGGLSSKWHKSQLAGLTKEQQRTLVEQWFLHRSTAFAPRDENSDSLATRQRRAKAEAAEHIQDLHRDGRLARLAEIPLLLNGLIALAVQRVHLPRSRFKAYEELTRLLLEEQPQRRERAAYAPRSTSSLSQERRERALARLAWKTHDSPESVALGKAAAREVLKDFCITDLGKTHGEAVDIADELLAIGAETIGILIDKSPVDIGFPHRAFQEFLAARHISDLPFEEQKAFVTERFENPQWYDVFLCLCHLNTRSGEVDDFVTIVESLELPTEMELVRQSFLAEIAFGDLHCSASTAGRLAGEAFEIIETGVHQRTRERLVELALDGLESDVLRSTVESRIQRWYPLRHPYRSRFYEEVAAWPQDDETQAILWRGLLNETDWNRQATAESLAKAFGGEPSVAERLFEMFFKPAEPHLLAFALHVLCLGWESDRRLPALLNDARFSTDESLRSVALIHRVKRAEHDMEDRELLIALSRERGSDSRRWREDRVRALIAGWPGDPEVKREAIRSATRSVTQRYRGEEVFEWDNAGIILLEGFQQDDEVAETIAHLFQAEEYTSHRLGLHGSWEPLVKAFAGHQILSPVVDAWLERKVEQEEKKAHQLSYLDLELCLVSRSEQAKGYLLEAKEETGVITWDQARWLLQGWGMRDEEAAAALTRLAGSNFAGGYFAHHLPDILLDKQACRQRLLDILREESGFRAEPALIELGKLGVNGSDEEFVEAAVDRCIGEVSSGADSLEIGNIIAHFPNHPKVREVALYQLQNRGYELRSVAKVYGADREIRRGLLEISSPIPANLRLSVVDRLTRLGPEDNFVHGLLSDYDQDTDANVKTAAAIGYAKSVKRRDEVSSYLLNELKEGLHVVGLDRDERGQAAFAALLELDRLDIVKAAWSGDKNKNITFGDRRETNLRLAAHLTRHWDRVEKVFGESFWEQVGWVSDDFLTEMAAHTTDSDLLDKIADKLQRGDQTLRIRARQWRGTPRLRDLCFNLVRDFRVRIWVETAPGITAAEILAEQFADDEETLALLESLVNQGVVSSALVIALSAGWSDSRAWKKLSEQVERQKLLLPARFYLAAARLPADEFVDGFSIITSHLQGDIWEFLPSCSRAVAARFERDTQVRELALSRLEAQPTSAEKMNYPSFLLQTNEQSERLHAWMRSEIKRQSEGRRLADVALDLSTGTVRSVGHVLLEHLLV